jgi:exonuclease VII large subunit
MEGDKSDQRKNFLKRNCQKIRKLNFLVATFEDPMKKREDFAVSLRKKKTHDLINAKRRKLMTASKSHAQSATADLEESKEGESGTSTKASASDPNNTVYKGYLPFEKGSETYEKMLAELCPEARSLHQQEFTVALVL